MRADAVRGTLSRPATTERHARMAKGYWIGRVTVEDEAGYRDYIAAGAPVYERYGARFVVRGGRCRGVEGETRTRNVVVEFPDYDTAVAAYESEEYRAAKAIRQRHAEADLVIVEGVDG